MFILHTCCLIKAEMLTEVVSAPVDLGHWGMMLTMVVINWWSAGVLPVACLHLGAVICACLSESCVRCTFFLQATSLCCFLLTMNISLLGNKLLHIIDEILKVVSIDLLHVKDFNIVCCLVFVDMLLIPFKKTRKEKKKDHSRHRLGSTAGLPYFQGYSAHGPLIHRCFIFWRKWKTL